MNILTLFPSPIQNIFNQQYHWYVGGVPQRVKISLSSAQILLLHGTPILCIAAPGAGYAIRVLRASAQLTADIDYSTHQQLALYTSQTYPQALTVSTFLDQGGAAVITHQYFNNTTAANGEDTPIVANAALYVYVPGGNPAAGTGTVNLYITYEILTL